MAEQANPEGWNSYDKFAAGIADRTPRGVPLKFAIRRGSKR